jgi:hypothetical protein
MTKCDVCGDELISEDRSLVGLEISLTFIKGVSRDVQTVASTAVGQSKRVCMVDLDWSDHPESKKVRDTFGKTEFNICFTCWLKSLGVKPIEP